MVPEQGRRLHPPRVQANHEDRNGGESIEVHDSGSLIQKIQLSYRVEIQESRGKT